MIKTTQHLNRRSFLKALGVGAAAGSLLPLLESTATSQDGMFPTRLVIFFSANGTMPNRWRPNGGEYDWSIPDTGILTPLRDHREKVLIVEGIDMVSARHGIGDGHQTGMGHMLTGTELLPGPFQGGNGGTAGYSGGISVDQHIANMVHNGEAFRSLEFGVQSGNPNNWSRMCYAGPDKPVEPSQNPHTAFDRIFESFNVGQERAAARRFRRGSVLDFVGQDLEKVKRKVSTRDHARIDQHLTSIRSLEQQLMTGDSGGFACEAPGRGEVFNSGAHENYYATGKAMTDLIVSSLSCGLTRVASIQWSRSVSNITLPWAGVPNTRHHDLSHEGDGNADAVEKIVLINRWYAEQFAYLISSLEAVPEGDGTLLDNTIVVWMNELGKGNSHTRNDVPIVVAGGAGPFKMGRYIRFGETPHNNFLLSLCHAMGLEQETSFGNPAYCTGVVPQLWG
jgi:hypothetical protein